MTTSLTLDGMVDLAISSTEAGAVNFNILKTFLHTMLQK